MLIKKSVNEWEIAGTRCRIYGTIYRESENLYLHWFGFDTGYVSCDARCNVPHDGGISPEEKELVQKIFDKIILPLIDKKVDKVVFDTKWLCPDLPEWSGDIC
ncbi:MAG TPA: hypothetical protein VFM18_00720 [Methanosarcina sp.]|nr:hypothetical protein [Methanosarcina sp.]